MFVKRILLIPSFVSGIPRGDPVAVEHLLQQQPAPKGEEEDQALKHERHEKPARFRPQPLPLRHLKVEPDQAHNDQPRTWVRDRP